MPLKPGNILVAKQQVGLLNWDLDGRLQDKCLNPGEKILFLKMDKPSGIRLFLLGFDGLVYRYITANSKITMADLERYIFSAYSDTETP